MEQSLKLCQRRRPVVDPIPAFLEQLRTFERECRTWGHLTSVDCGDAEKSAPEEDGSSRGTSVKRKASADAGSEGNKKRSVGPALGPAIGPLAATGPAMGPTKRPGIGPAARPTAIGPAVGPAKKQVIGPAIGPSAAIGPAMGPAKSPAIGPSAVGPAVASEKSPSIGPVKPPLGPSPKRAGVSEKSNCDGNDNGEDSEKIIGPAKRATVTAICPMKPPT